MKKTGHSENLSTASYDVSGSTVRPSGCEEMLRFLLDITDAAVLLLDAEGTVLYASRAAADLLGRTRSELSESALFYFIPALEDEWPTCLLSAELAEPGRRWAVRSLKDKDKTVQWRIHFVETEHRRLMMLILSNPPEAETNTERHVAEQMSTANDQLTESNRQLEKSIQLAEKLAQEAHVAGRAKTEFLNGLSYEIRTPMNVIVGMLSLLKETPMSEEQTDYLNTAEEAAGHLMAVISDIMDLSQIESRQLDFDRIQFNLADLVDDALDSYAVRAQEKGVELTCVIEQDVPLAIVGDPRRLKRLLENFLEYSVAVTDHGEVNIEISLDKQSGSTADIRFLIADTGPGLSPEVIQVLTNASPVDVSPSPLASVGFGVTLAKQLAQMMGAQISAVNDDRGGAVWFTLPFEIGRNTTSDIPGDQSYSECEIIVADDNMSTRRALALNASELGCRVKETSSATELATRIHLSKAGYAERLTVLVDVEMPAAAHALKPNGTLPALLTLVGLVPRTGFQEGQGFAREDFASFLTKPVKRTRLIRTLARLLKSGGDERTASSPAATERSSAGAGLRVLVVEDNENNQKVALNILRRLGCDVEIAVNGKESLERLSESEDEFDVIFMDIQMPVMDGREAAMRIRSGEAGARYCEIPIVAVTAHAFEEDKVACLKAGMNDYLAKPVETEHVRSALERFARI